MAIVIYSFSGFGRLKGTAFSWVLNIFNVLTHFPFHLNILHIYIYTVIYIGVFTHKLSLYVTSINL